MPVEITNPNIVRELSQRRQQVEAAFAREVYTVFNQGVPLNLLQKQASSLIKMMENGPRESLLGALREEGKLRLWEKVPKNPSGLAIWESSIQARRLDATDCADVIRLFGAWVEQGGLDFGAKPQGNSPGTVKEAYRVGGKEVWGEGVRDRAKGWAIEDHLRSFMRDQNASFTGMAGARVGGGGSKRATAGSSVLQLDRLFGLVVACDISGTTADCVFSLELVGGEFGMTAGYYMLPLGTIVHNMHHSVLEVALVASLNGEMNYHIGFFDTLKPTRVGAAFPAELHGLQSAIDEADMRMRISDLHHLCYYEGENLKGAFQFTELELPQLRNSDITNAVWMRDRAPSLGGFPERHTVTELLDYAHFNY